MAEPSSKIKKDLRAEDVSAAPQPGTPAAADLSPAANGRESSELPVLPSHSSTPHPEMDGDREEPGLAWDAENLDLNPPPTDQLLVPHPVDQGDESATVISKVPLRSTPPPTQASPKTAGRDAVVSRGEDTLAGSLRGRRLAHFELIAPIGVGGMAAVIKGRDLQLDRTVALKILPPEMAGDPENVRRFHQEARAAAKLDHENVARVFFCGEDQKLHFIAFEFVQGDNLRTILERRGRLPVAEALNYILQVATGLAHAASRGVVHRDIKPSNIIITPGGRAKLVDMGLARSQSPQDDKGLTQSGVTLGTFDYISPEQAMEPREADARSDIYSLGCTFYHVLTGQPPAPEGTAARKLHFHQSEAPVDPRELNPEVPDEVAAILARMMAKNPRDRYQRPEHLVQHLLRVAQALPTGPGGPDAGNGRSESVLFVDAPLPAPPARPLFLTALAVAAVIALVFVLQQSTPQAQTPAPFHRPSRLVSERPDDQRPADVKPSRPDPLKDEGKKPVPSGPESQRPDFVFDKDRTVKQLRDFTTKEVRPGSNVEIVVRVEQLDLGTAGLTFPTRPRSVTIRGESPSGEGGPLPTIWLKHSPEPPPPAWTALRFDDVETVVLQNLRLIIDARGIAEMTAVHLFGGRNHRIENCQFIQANPGVPQGPLERKPLCSLVLESRSGLESRPRLLVRDCVFLGGEGHGEGPAGPGFKFQFDRIGRGGQEAITRRGPGVVRIEQCAFGPHLSCLRLEKSGKPEEDDVRFSHCSVLLADGSAAFHVTAGVSCRLEVSSSLFSRPGPARMPADPSPGTDSATLLRLVNGAKAVQFWGADNRYHNLDSFWTGPTQGQPVATWEDFLSRLRGNSGHDNHSRALESNPWNEKDPLETLREAKLASTFRVNREAPELRLSQLPGRLVGVESCDGTNYLDDLSEPGKPLERPRGEKTVDPLVAETGGGIFKTLASALNEAEQGDVILIRHNGLLPLNPVPPGKKDVTIRAASGYRPILTLETSELDASMFRVHNARIEFQQLEFRLAPSQKGFESQAVVTILGDGGCTFKDCVITLGPSQGCSLSAVALADPGMVMRKGTRIEVAGPAITFEKCFVRGQGDLVWCRASRPFQLKATQTLAALTGSALVVQGGKLALASEETDADVKATVDFKHVTAIVRGPLLHLRPAGKDLKGLVPLSWTASNSLLAAGGPREDGGAMVLISGAEATETTLRDRLAWTGQANAYSFPDSMLDHQTGMVGMPMNRVMPLKHEKWATFASETDSRFPEPLEFPGAPENLSRAMPEHFLVAKWKSYGARLDQLPLRDVSSPMK